MPPQDSAQDLYANEMIRARSGIALWDPDPVKYPRIRVGHVGFVQDGCFMLLFDANGDGESQQLPQGFIPLPPECRDFKERTRLPYQLHMESGKTAGLDVGSSSVSSLAGGTLVTRSSSAQGALLITHSEIKAVDATRTLKFRQYIEKHHTSWIRFARDQGYEVHRGDIILVTGHDTATEYAMAAYANSRSGLCLEFQVSVPGLASASASVWGSWTVSPEVHRNCGPMGRSFRNVNLPNLLPSSDSSQCSSGLSLVPGSGEGFDHCVFVRGYRMRKRSEFPWPFSIRAGAGYHELPRGDRRGSSSGPILAHEGPEEELKFILESEGDIIQSEHISNTATLTDPLEPLFTYIFLKSPAGFAIVHDLDILRLAKMASVNHFEDLPALLALAKPDVTVDEADVACLLLEPDDDPNTSPATESSSDAPTAHEHDRVSTTGPKVSGERTEDYEGLDDSWNAYHQLLTKLSEQPLIQEALSNPASPSLLPAVSSHELSTADIGLRTPRPQQASLEQRSGPPELLSDKTTPGNPIPPFPYASRLKHRSLSVPPSGRLSRSSLDLSVRCTELRIEHNIIPMRHGQDISRRPLSMTELKSFQNEMLQNIQDREQKQRTATSSPPVGCAFTATIESYTVSLLCEHEAAFTLFLRDANTVKDYLSMQETIALAELDATFKMQYEHSVAEIDMKKSKIMLDLRSAKLFTVTSTMPITVTTEITLHLYLSRYMKELQERQPRIEVELANADDSDIKCLPQRRYTHPKDLFADLVIFAPSAAVNKYMLDRWRRAVLPEQPEDQFLAPLAETSSLWATNTVIKKRFLIRFDAPEVRARCPHSVFLYLNIEDIRVFGNNDTATQPEVYRGWRLAFVVDTYEANTSATIQIKLVSKSARFSVEYSSLPNGSETRDIIAFLQNDYLPMLGCMSLETIFSSHDKANVHFPSTMPRYVKGPERAAGRTSTYQQRQLDESIRAYGFDQIMVISEAAINCTYHSLWLGAGDHYPDNLMSAFLNVRMKASFGPPVVRLLSSNKAVIWFQMTDCILFKWSNEHADVIPMKYKTATDYVTDRVCCFAYEVDLTMIEDHGLGRANKRSYKANTWWSSSNSKSSGLIRHLMLNLDNAKYISELSVTSGFGTGHASVIRLRSVLSCMHEYIKQLAETGADIICSIPVWTDRGTPSSILTDLRYEIVAKNEVTLQNCSDDHDTRDCPVVLMLGVYSFRSLPQTVVPWNDAWGIRDDDSKTLSTIYLSHDAFLEPLLLPMLKAINKRTTVITKSITASHSQWLPNASTFDSDLCLDVDRRTCDWRKDRSKLDEDNLHYIWDYSDELIRRRRDVGEEVVFCCHTKNELAIPLWSHTGHLDIHLSGESTLTLEIKTSSQDANLVTSIAKWAGIMQFQSGPNGPTAVFVDKIIPTWDQEEPESILSQLHKQALGKAVKTGDVVLAARMLEDRWKFMCPAVENFAVSSPVIRPAGGLVVQVLHTPSSTHQLSIPGESQRALMRGPIRDNSWLLQRRTEPQSLYTPVSRSKVTRESESPSNPQSWGWNPTVWRPSNDYVASLSSDSDDERKIRQQSHASSTRGAASSETTHPPSQSQNRSIWLPSSRLDDAKSEMSPKPTQPSPSPITLQGARRSDSPADDFIALPSLPSSRPLTPPPAYEKQAWTRTRNLALELIRILEGVP